MDEEAAVMMARAGSRMMEQNHAGMSEERQADASLLIR